SQVCPRLVDRASGVVQRLLPCAPDLLQLSARRDLPRLELLDLTLHLELGVGGRLVGPGFHPIEYRAPLLELRLHFLNVGFCRVHVLGSLSSGGDIGDALEIALDERLVHAPGGLVCEDPPREIELGVDASGCCPLLAESEPTETSRIE